MQLPRQGQHHKSIIWLNEEKQSRGTHCRSHFVDFYNVVCQATTHEISKAQVLATTQAQHGKYFIPCFLENHSWRFSNRIFFAHFLFLQHGREWLTQKNTYNSAKYFSVTLCYVAVEPSKMKREYQLEPRRSQADHSVLSLSDFKLLIGILTRWIGPVQTAKCGESIDKRRISSY